MTKTLLLMRHAKSDWHNDLDDFDRPLNQRGVSDVPKVATALIQHDLVPDRIISSTACRARQTTELICQTMGLDSQSVEWLDDLYLADQKTLLFTIQRSINEVDQCLLLVAHNPGMDELTRLLSIEPPPRAASGKLMTTAAVAVFELQTQALPGSGHHLKEIIRPREL